jgi:hypothetical protein
MRRVLALVAAAAMVAGSIALRSRLDEREEDRANPLRVVCAAELGPVCEALRPQVTVEPATATADRLGRSDAADPGLDGWLVPAPWPQIVDGRRRLAALPPLFTDVGAPLARSPLVLVVQNALADRLASRCGGTVGWKCLGEAAGIGQAKPAHTSDALGTLVIGQAAAAYFGRVDLSTIDLEDPGFASWFQRLERATPPLPSGASLLDEMLGTNFAAYDAVGTVEAEAGPILARAARRNDVRLLYPSPMATADVVLAGAGGDTARRRRDLAGEERVRRAFADAGWKVDGLNAPAGGLPSPGFLDALRARAAEVRR